MTQSDNRYGFVGSPGFLKFRGDGEMRLNVSRFSAETETGKATMVIRMARKRKVSGKPMPPFPALRLDVRKQDLSSKTLADYFSCEEICRPFVQLH